MRYFEEHLALKEDLCDDKGHHVVCYFDHHVAYLSKHDDEVLDWCHNNLLGVAYLWTNKYPHTIVSFTDKAQALRLKMRFEW